MEQKRTLWIVAATGVFLLVVVGAALLLSLKNEEPVQTYYNPKDGFVNSYNTPDYTSYSTNGSTQQGVAPLAQSGEIALIGEGDNAASSVSTDNTTGTINTEKPLKVENVTVITENALVYGNNTTTTIDLNSLKSNPANAVSVVPQNNANATQAATATQVYTPSPDSYYAPSATKTPTVVPKKEVSQTNIKTQTKTNTTASSKKQTKSSSKSSVAKTAPKAPAKPDTYWIQVGSYEAKKTADEARTVLENNKIPNEVFTYKDTKGRLFYRVRVGPYTTKSEAEYWQKRIASTNEFGKTNSYIVKN